MASLEIHLRVPTVFAGNGTQALSGNEACAPDWLGRAHRIQENSLRRWIDNSYPIRNLEWKLLRT